MTRLTVKSEKEKEFRRKMHQLKIFEKDIKESFVFSSGPGGQNVNKVATCVVLKHLPTQIQIKCQESRTQRQNRYRARQLLVQKIERRIKEKKAKDIAAKEKKKRQSRKRPKKVKEGILENKHRQSEKKQNRRRININKLDQL